MDWIEDSLKTDGTMHIDTTEAFYGYNDEDGGIWLSGEDSSEYKGLQAYQYYSQDYKNRTFGVLNTWEAQLKKRGWYSQWYDAGTVMIYEI